MLTDEALEALEPATRALDESQAAAERALGAAQAAIQAALDRRDELEGKIASYRTMQEQRRQRLEWVRGAKEASTLMAELDLARSVLAKEEAEFMRSGDAVTESERRAAEAERALEELRARQAAARAAGAGRRVLLYSKEGSRPAGRSPRKPTPGLRPRSPASSTSPSRSRRSWCSGASALPISPRRSSVPISSASPIRSLGPTWRAPWRWWRAWSVPGRRSWCTATTTWTAS